MTNALEVCYFYMLLYCILHVFPTDADFYIVGFWFFFFFIAQTVFKIRIVLESLFIVLLKFVMGAA